MNSPNNRRKPPAANPRRAPASEASEGGSSIRSAALVHLKSRRVDIAKALDGVATDDFVFFPKLAGLIRKAATPAPTDRERVEWTVAAANSGTLTIEQRNRLGGLRMMAGDTNKDRALRLNDRIVSDLIGAFEVLVEGSDDERARLEKILSEVLPYMIVLSPSWSKSGRRDHVVALSNDGALLYALRMLCPTGEFAGALSRCQYSKCRRFFLVAKDRPGRPKRMYCRSEHYRKGDAEEARKRMAIKRRKS